MQGSLDRIVEGLVREMTSWASLEIRVHEKIVKLPEGYPGGDKLATFDHRYIETANGQRHLEIRATDHDKWSFHVRYDRDGKVSDMVEYDRRENERQVRISVGKGFGMKERQGYTDRPAPLSQLYVGLEPLHQAIRRGTITGSSVVIRRPCTIVTLDVRYGGRPGTLEYHLDRATSVPLRVVYRESGSPPQWTWEADDLTAVEGFHVPFKSHYIDTSHGTAPHEIGRREYTVQSLAYNKTYPRTTFLPTPQAGVPITGSPEMIEQAYGKQALSRRESPTPKAAGVGSAGPVTATPSLPWTTYAARGAFGIGVALLLASVVALRRTRPGPEHR